MKGRTAAYLSNHSRSVDSVVVGASFGLQIRPARLDARVVLRQTRRELPEDVLVGVLDPPVNGEEVGVPLLGCCVVQARGVVVGLR